jgi:hypothetical protein
MTRKICILALISIIFLPGVKGQEINDKPQAVNFNIVAGISLQNLKGTDFWGEKLDNRVIQGYRAGFMTDILIYRNFHFLPGLLFSVKGARKEIVEVVKKSDENEVTTKIRLSYIEIPVNLLYRPKLGEGHILMGLGPYAAYGIRGRVKTKGTGYTNVIPVRFKNTITIDDPSVYAYYRALDAGANFLLGYELYYGIFCYLNAQIGMMDVNPGYEQLSNDKTSYKNRGFGLLVGYRF